MVDVKAKNYWAVYYSNVTWWLGTVVSDCYIWNSRWTYVCGVWTAV